MKNKNYSQPYATFGYEKIDAPAGKPKKQPKATKTVGSDLRVGGKK